MRRVHLFEWEDQKWFPDVLRNNMTDFLRNMILWQEIYTPAVTIIKEAIINSKLNTVIDLCSGAGGGMEFISSKINRELKNPVNFILTDKYPNSEIIEILNQQPHITYNKEPVDATKVPAELKGVKTLFSSFHHFKPDVAVKILEDATKNNHPILVFEGAGKSVAEFIAFLLLFPVMIYIITPFIRPFKWSRLLFTYLIPVLPLCIYWDGLVSILRMYTVKDLYALTSSFNNSYFWKAGKIKGKFTTITFLSGMPG